jgi:hypothetical protein
MEKKIDFILTWSLGSILMGYLPAKIVLGELITIFYLLIVIYLMVRSHFEMTNR